MRDGKKYWITSVDILTELGYKIGDEKVYPNLTMVESGEPIRENNVLEFKTNLEPLSEPTEATSEVKPEVIELPAHPDETPIEPHVIHEGLTSIIILAHINSYQLFHLTGDCIGHIRQYTDKNKTPYEIILVFNGDGARPENNKTYADKVIENKENLGYAKAVNQAIRVSQGEYIAIVNNDVKVYDHWLEDMLEAMQKTDLVAATPMYSRDEPWKRGVEANALREAQLNVPLEETLSDFEDFSCVLMKRNVLDTIGLFDERFFFSCEDIDFKRRMKEAGFVYKTSKKVNTHHIIGATEVKDRARLMDESKAAFQEKWGNKDGL